jgi:hypothetical protein
VSFRKKEQLYSLVSGALDLPGAYAEGAAAGGLSVPVKTALAYIQNCRKDIRVRSIALCSLWLCLYSDECTTVLRRIAVDAERQVPHYQHPQ